MTGTRLELTWPNKDKFLFVPKDDTGKPVWVERDHPAASEVRISDFTGEVGTVNPDNPYADNLLITGDSLDALRILTEVPEYRAQYRGKVKLIYIDPPFNTGQTFAHYDDWMEHSTWLSFMRDRLLLMKELVSADGSIWVHLDDAEVHRMRLLMDEVFGAHNFVATIAWEKTDSPRMDASRFSSAHDSLLVYAVSSQWIPNKRRNESSEEDFRFTEPDGRRYSRRELRKWGSNSLRTDRPRLWYPLTAPDGSEVWPRRPDGQEGCWRWQPEKVAQDAARIEWVQRDGGLEPYVKTYSDGERKPIPPKDLWSIREVGGNPHGRADIKALFPGITPFSTPKPETLLQEVGRIASNPGDIVLDVFAGSGTTAAVAHKMGRRWVTSEILPATVEQFTLPRLTKVVNGEDPGGITSSVGWTGGGGFRTLEVGPSMYVDTPLGVMLAEWATNGRFARAVAGQLGFEWQTKKHAPFCGVRGRMRLAVFDGAVGIEEATTVVSALGEKERVTIVAKAILPGVEEWVAENSRGSRVRKAPRDILTDRSRTRRRRQEPTS